MGGSQTSASRSESGAVLWPFGSTPSGATSANDVLTLFADLRAEYIQRSLSEEDRRIAERADIPVNLAPDDAGGVARWRREVSGGSAYDWADWRFHLKHRLHLSRASSRADFDTFSKMISGDETYVRNLAAIILDGVDVTCEDGSNERRYYDLSVLPLNLLLGELVMKYFIPPLDYLRPHATQKADPYGLLWAPSRAAAAKGRPVAITSKKDNLLLGAHKFTHTLLMNVDFYCPIGCSDCYKTRFGTREHTDSLTVSGGQPNLYHHPEFGVVRPPSAAELNEQAARVVSWMNDDPRGREVYDVIISGGEPLILSDEKLESLLAILEGAKNLRILRICTGTLFLGLPVRINERLADILDDFSRRTGVRVTIQAHLASHEQITAESVIAISKLRKRGINIYSQVPIKEGINFFVDDLERSVNELAELGRKQVGVGVEPYMLIVDMHPSTNAFYVPIEPLIAVWGALVESHDHPGLERPRTLSILFDKGNIILSGNTLLAMEKKVDREGKVVTYRIPRIGPGSSYTGEVAEVFEYSEPLNHLNEDPDSLKKLRSRWAG